MADERRQDLRDNPALGVKGISLGRSTEIRHWLVVTQVRPQQVRAKLAMLGRINAQHRKLRADWRISIRTYPFDCATLKAEIIPSMEDDPDFEGIKLGCNR